MSLFISANTRTTATIFTLRKNRTDTAITISVGAGATGIFEDSSNTVSFAVDDEIDWKIVYGVDTTGITFEMIGLDYMTTDNNGLITSGCAGTSSDITIAPSVTNYYVTGGGMIEGVTSETDAQLEMREAFTMSNLTVYARANTITAPSTVTVMKNGTASAMTVIIGGSTTGFITDTINTVDFSASDTISYKVVTGDTGTQLTIAQLAIWTVPTAAPEIIQGSGGRSQGRSPLYKTRTRQRDSEKIAAVIVRVRIALEYEVEKLSVQIPMPYIIQRPRPILKYASAILTPIAHILPLPVRPTPSLPTIVKVRLTLPLAYEVTSLRLGPQLQLKAGCSYEVDKLITREQQNKLRILAVNFLGSDL